MTAGKRGILLDIDGTLLDTSHLHTLSWWRALRALGETVPMTRLHRLIGMGGDQLVPEALGHELEGADDEYGRQFERFYEEVVCLPGAHRLVEVMVDRGFTVVLASSAREADLKRFRQVLGVDDLIAGATSSDDAESTKPDSEIFDVALDDYGLDRDRTTVIGDTIWDGQAAQRGGLAFLGVESGGNPREALVGAGARAVYLDVGELADAADEAPFA